MKKTATRQQPTPRLGPATLRQTCVAARLDDGARRCPICPVRPICTDETRWIVRRDRATNRS